jgi:hypothetical protein
MFARWRRMAVILLVPLIQALCLGSAIALPRRLVLALDGISYRDMKALQEGVTYKDIRSRQFHRQAFNDGYFPVSRNVSTFPSTSDVAWTDIFGDRPLPGYQRTYFSEAGNRQVSASSVTTSAEHERQMNWQVQSGYRRAMAYVYPLKAFNYELREVSDSFLSFKGEGDDYYAYIRSTDDAQHMSGDIFAMLCLLDDRLKDLRARYKAIEGRDLEILIMSDHGHNRAGAGKRVKIRAFLERAGYRIARSIENSRDVILPTCGIESWAEVHNAPAETERLAELLGGLEGVDLVTARVPGETNRFLVVNTTGERAEIEWNVAKNSFRYTPKKGDPIGYGPVVKALADKHELDADGFAAADDWMAETISNRYPLALERITRGLSCNTLNPATILISLKNGYVNAGWLVKTGSRFATLGGTHGGLDDICSDGILLSSFAPTKDTSTSRVAGLFDDFPGLRDFRAAESGAEWVTAEEQGLTRIAREPFDSSCRTLPGGGVFLRVWTPRFGDLDEKAPLEVTMEETAHFASAQIHRGDPKPIDHGERQLRLDRPIRNFDECPWERVYAFPSEAGLEQGKAYRIEGWIGDPGRRIRVFKFSFRTDGRGMPVAY